MRPIDLTVTVICVLTIVLCVYIQAATTRYQHLPGAAFDRWTGRVVHPGEPVSPP